jgi:glutaminyl-peptide cyclotransferase
MRAQPEAPDVMTRPPPRSLLRAVSCLALAVACNARGGSARAREFDGQRAFSYLAKQMQFGPRVPGTPAHEQTGDWILQRLRATADTVLVQSIAHVTRTGDTLHLRNFVARFRPTASDHVLFLAHWDTRPHADQSQNLGQQRLPVPGANDGASGVAVLLGVADALKTKPPALSVDLLFADGEDYGNFAKDTNDVLIGSRYFAAHQPSGYPPLFAVLFDMVGKADPHFYYEGNSEAFAPEVVERVWRTAADLGYGRVFIPGVKHTLTDDHTALQHAGIHAIDVVDFDYPAWHTTEDTMDKVAAASLQIVGDVALGLVR